MSGQGLGLRVQKAANSTAASFWEDDQVCLLVGRALSSRAAAPFAATGGGAHLGGRGDYLQCSMSPHSGCLR